MDPMYTFGSKVKVLVAWSCLTLRDTVGRRWPGSAVWGILQARIPEWGPFPSPEDLPNLGMEPRSPELLAHSLPLSHHAARVHIHSASKWGTQNGVSAEVVLYSSGHLGVFLLLLTLHRRDLPGSHSGRGQIINLAVSSNADELGKLVPKPTRLMVINKRTPLTNIFHALTMDQCRVGA